MSALSPNNPANSKIGVIDLGTNTFHLLIVQQEEEGWTELFRIRKFVELGEEGIETIGAAALDRAWSALLTFNELLIEQKVTRIQANATAALRTATNGPEFLAKINSQLKLDVQLINGDQEALLIYEGVKQAIPSMDQTSLIMDIGGGSVEFIIGDKNEIFWARSFPIGVAVLFNAFHKSDPISSAEIQMMNEYFIEILEPLHAQLQRHPCKYLIGASGTFDVLEKILPIERVTTSYASIDPNDYPPLYQRFINAPLEQRLSWPELPQQRARLIVVALVLIKHILQQQVFEQILVSKFAMKEGMIAQLMNKS